MLGSATEAEYNLETGQVTKRICRLCKWLLLLFGLLLVLGLLVTAIQSHVRKTKLVETVASYNGFNVTRRLRCGDMFGKEVKDSECLCKWNGHQWNCSVIYETTRELLGLTGLVLLMTGYPL